MAKLFLMEQIAQSDRGYFDIIVLSIKN